MNPKTIITTAIFILFFKIACTQGVISTDPTQNAINVDRNTTIKVKFDSLMYANSFTNQTFVVSGLRIGLIQGSLNYTDADTSVTFTPAKDFCAGELVTIVVTKNVLTANLNQLDSAFAFSFTTSTANGSGIFSTSIEYETGNFPVSIFSADFDNDGDFDLSVANHLGANANILSNNGDGSFTDQKDYETPNGTYYIFSADFNADRYIDLAVAGESVNIISILLNNGNNTFASKVDYETGSNPHAIVSTDLDSDGDLDLATANEVSNNVSVLLNNGDGTFNTKTDYSIEASSQSINSADFDNDGDMDLVATNGANSYTVSILLNNGNGVFLERYDYSTGNDPFSVYPADFNADGNIDLAVAYRWTAVVTVLFNDGKGNFDFKLDFPTGYQSQSVISSDFDGNGFSDIALAQLESNTVSILLNNGDSTFTPSINYSTGDFCVSVFSADFDGDGDMDLAAINGNSNTVSILFNKNSGPDIKKSNNSYNFGSLSENTSKTWNLNISNFGISGNLEISEISTSTSYFTIDTTSGIIEPDSSLTITITFTPTGIDSYSDSLAISSNDPDDPVTYVYLSGVCGTQISGTISEDSIWTIDKSPYVVTGDLTVSSGVTLTIEAGVEVLFDGFYSITVNGNLLINGTSDENVLFTSVYEPGPGNWNRIHFSSTGSGDLNYLTLQASTDGIHAENSNSIIINNSLFDENSNYGIYLNSTSAIIKNTQVKNNGTGIYGISSSPEIDSCTISDNEDYGLYFNNSTSSPIITNSIIADNSSYGIYYTNGNGQFKILNNQVTGNTNWGIYIDGASSGSQLNKNIINNNGGGISSFSNTNIENNIISENNGDGIYTTGFSISIRYNRIENNTCDGIETTADITIDQNYISGNNENGINALSNPTLRYNEINNNGNDGIETSGLPTINYNNFSSNTGYNVKATKQGTQTINAENNYWGTINEIDINAKILDYDDDGTLVRVDYSPFYTDKVELLPVSGFTGQTLAGGKIKLSWNTHILASQYLLYHDNQTGIIDTTSAWVILDSTNLEYTAILPDGEYKFGIKVLDKNGKKSPLDSCQAIADGTPPTLLSATGNTGHTEITVTFSEDVDYISTESLTNWTLSGGLVIENIKAGDFWTTKANMLTAREYIAAEVINEKLYVVGGRPGESTLEEYDPITNTWTTKANMPTGRHAPGVGVINGKLYVVGGGISNCLSTVEEYDPIINTWTTKANMPTARWALGIGVVKGKLYAIGGNNGWDLSVVEEYDPVTDTWTTKESMPIPGHAIAVGVINDKLYVIDSQTWLVEYDPATDTWTYKVNMKSAREWLATGVINGKFYAVGGWGSGIEFSIMEEYNPVIDTWNYKANMPTARRGLAIGVINDKLYAVGGINGNGLLSILEEYTPFNEEATLSLANSQVLPSPETQITITCNNIKDIYGNQSQTDTVILIINPLPSANITDSTHVSCYGYSDGMATVTPSGGTPPYTYIWDDELNTTDSVVTDLAANVYYHVTLTDIHGVVAVDSVILTEPEPININLEYSEIICPESNDGYIDISVSGGTPAYSYKWSNDSTTEDINNLETGEYIITVTDDNNCSETEIITINPAVPYAEEEICLVSVNAANKNMVIWEKTSDKGIVTYNIYRETINVGEYESIGSVPFENLSVFVDTTSNAKQRSYQYKLAIVDTCDNESEKSNYHRTMLLQVSVGINAYNLEWDDYEYEGGGFIFSKFYIYRGQSEDSLEIIDSIGANYLTYIDENPPEGLLFYQVAGVKPEGCSPTGMKKSITSEDYILSYTNVEDNGITGINDMNYTHNVRIYPNPFSDKTIIEFPNPDNNNYQLIITTISGKTVAIIENIKTNKVEFEKGILPSGFYMIELRGDNLYRGKIVIE
ncbi:MAG: VCBS repeat-containing protein [Bacteroidales bacterium]|nr:VCBS repeat-containing protein [Bacteroidales bacterium]